MGRRRLATNMELRYITVDGAKLLLASSGTPKHLCTTCCGCVPFVLDYLPTSDGPYDTVVFDSSGWMSEGVATPGHYWRIGQWWYNKIQEAWFFALGTTGEVGGYGEQDDACGAVGENGELSGITAGAWVPKNTNADWSVYSPGVLEIGCTWPVPRWYVTNPPVEGWLSEWTPQS